MRIANKKFIPYRISHTCVRARTPEFNNRLTPAAACSTVSIPSEASRNRAQGSVPRSGRILSSLDLGRLNWTFLKASLASKTASLNMLIDHWSILVKALSNTTWSYGGISFTSDKFLGTGALKTRMTKNMIFVIFHSNPKWSSFGDVTRKKHHTVAYTNEFLKLKYILLLLLHILLTDVL